MKMKGFYSVVFNKLMVWFRLSDLFGISNEKCYKIIMDIFSLPELGISEKWKEEFREYSLSFSDPISHKDRDEEIAFSTTNRIIMGQFIEEVYYDVCKFENDPGFKDRIREIVESDFKKFKIIK